MRVEIELKFEIHGKLSLRVCVMCDVRCVPCVRAFGFLGTCVERMGGGWVYDETVFLLGVPFPCMNGDGGLECP